MTDRVQHLTVILDKDYRTDDVEAITRAIHMVKGVNSVVLGTPVSMEDYSARSRVKHELWKQIQDLFK